MKKHVKHLLLVLLGCLLSACQPVEEQDHSVITDSQLPMPSKEQTDEVTERIWPKIEKFNQHEGLHSKELKHDASATSDICFSKDYILLTDSKNHQLATISIKDVTYESYGEFGSGPNQFNAPSAIASQGEQVYVLDEGNQRIQVLDESFQTIDSIQIPEDFFRPGLGDDQQFIAVDSKGCIYLSTWNPDYGHILRYDPQLKEFNEIGENFIGSISEYDGKIYALNSFSLIGEGKEKGSTYPYKHYLLEVNADQLTLLKEVDEGITPGSFIMKKEGLLTYSVGFATLMEYNADYQYERGLCQWKYLEDENKGLYSRMTYDELNKRVYLAFPESNAVYEVEL